VASGESNTLSVEDCRRLLGGAGQGFSDDQIARVRDEFYALANIAVAFYEKDRAIGSEDVSLRCLPLEEQESIDERAAILEFDAGIPRSRATRLAAASHIRPDKAK
jgi:hypothetical protein